MSNIFCQGWVSFCLNGHECRKSMWWYVNWGIEFRIFNCFLFLFIWISFKLSSLWRAGPTAFPVASWNHFQWWLLRITGLFLNRREQSVHSGRDLFVDRDFPLSSRRYTEIRTKDLHRGLFDIWYWKVCFNFDSMTPRRQLHYSNNCVVTKTPIYRVSTTPNLFAFSEKNIILYFSEI